MIVSPARNSLHRMRSDSGSSTSALDGPAQRTGAQRRVVALVGQEQLGRLGELEADALALELARAPA